jgi:hypothetical protein
MERYHRALAGFDAEKLGTFTNALNGRRFIFSNHFFEQVRTRFNDHDQRDLGELLQAVKLQAGQAFEYYIEAGQIEKACYRIPFNRVNDIIIVLSNRKEVITIYSNAVGDNHKTLNGGNYGIQ